jgi:hypothetical protein
MTRDEMTRDEITGDEITRHKMTGDEITRSQFLQSINYKNELNRTAIKLPDSKKTHSKIDDNRISELFDDSRGKRG